MLLYACGVLAIYALTIKIGLLGNLWTVESVLRSRRPRNRSSLSPSDRLRNYIGLLAIVDLLVIVSLTLRIIFVVLPLVVSINKLSCRIVFVLNRLTRFGSLLCLSCISFERFITICKPFNSRTRKRFIQLTPVIALFTLLIIFSAIILLSFDVEAEVNEANCIRIGNKKWWSQIARWTMAVGFCTLLIVVSVNYGQIVRHVRRKFWQRKTRVVANARSVAKPRYLRGMTAAIVRIACFHVLCWLPFSIIQLMPRIWFSEAVLAQLLDEEHQSSLFLCGVLLFEWLTYVSSSMNWILYCAMNRDLRTIIRESTERRKRSTLSNNSSPSNLQKSIRRQMAQSLRFFYYINSEKSRDNSFDDSLTTYKNGSIDSQNSSPFMAGRSASTAGTTPTIESLLGMRNASLHTYCSPRSSNGFRGGSVKDYSSSTAKSSKSKVLTTIMQSSSPNVSQTPRLLLTNIFRSSDKSNMSLNNFI